MTFTLFLIVNSCKKELFTVNNQEAIEAAQQFLNLQTGNQTLTTGLFRKAEPNKLLASKTTSLPQIPTNADIKLNADWENAKTYQEKDKTIIEVPLLYDGVFMFSFSPLNTDEKINKNKSITRLLFFKTKEKTEGYFMTFINSDEYLKLKDVNPQNNNYLNQEPNFSGAIIYHNLDGSYNTSKRFSKNENLLNKLSSSKNEIPGKISQAIPPGCYEEELWEVFGVGCTEVPGGLHCNYIYSVPAGTYLICPDGNNTNPGGGGGSTTNPPSEIITNLTNLCLNSTYTTITNTGNINNKINTLIQGVFNVNDKVNLIYNQSTSLPSSRLGTTVAGYAGIDVNGNKKYNVIVNLNVNVLPGYSQELTAVTMLHEALHGYFEYKGVFTADATAQHLIMATKYVDLLRTSVQSVYPNLTDIDANILILSEMADIYTQSPQTYNNLLAQYNITASQYNSIIPTYKSGSAGTRCGNQ